MLAALMPQRKWRKVAYDRNAVRGDFALIETRSSYDTLAGEHVIYWSYCAGTVKRVNRKGRVLEVTDYHGPRLVDFTRDRVHLASASDFSVPVPEVVAEAGHLIVGCVSVTECRNVLRRYAVATVKAA